jgi:flagellar motor protein MotB
MRRLAWAAWLVAPILVAGCAENSMVVKGQLQQLQQQQVAMTRQNQELQSRAAALDRDNQELEALLAQSRQRAQVLDDQLNLVRDQLGGITAQLAQLREEKEASEQRAQALTASIRRRHGVSITPNNSFLETLPAIHLPDVQVRRDGDVIRIELPAHRLFEGETAQFHSDAAGLITDVAAEVVRTYPDQMIGVEGHTDSEPLQSGMWRNNHHLSVARALAVYEVLLTRTRLQPEQLYVAGHGGNHPVASNATAEGRKRNQRVELVIYPERRP